MATKNGRGPIFLLIGAVIGCAIFAKMDIDSREDSASVLADRAYDRAMDIQQSVGMIGNNSYQANEIRREIRQRERNNYR